MGVDLLQDYSFLEILHKLVLQHKHYTLLEQPTLKTLTQIGEVMLVLWVLVCLQEELPIKAHHI